MRIIISPAKKMKVNTDVFPCQELPAFLDKTQELLDYMQSLDYSQCKTIWKCNDKIAELNYRRFSKMNLEKSLTPAILSYEGIQYQYMACLLYTSGNTQRVGISDIRGNRKAAGRQGREDSRV